jgi:hypothetical protein
LQPEGDHGAGWHDNRLGQAEDAQTGLLVSWYWPSEVVLADDGKEDFGDELVGYPDWALHPARQQIL